MSSLALRDVKSRYADPLLLSHSFTLCSDFISPPFLRNLSQLHSTWRTQLREGSTYLRDKQESVNFWELAARVRSLGDILIGYERTNDDSNLSTIIVNPKEADDTGVSKDTALEWSAGDKVIVLTPPRGKKMKTKANKTKKAVGSAKIDGLLSEEQIDLLDKSALRTALRASQRDLKRIRKGVSELTRPAL